MYQQQGSMYQYYRVLKLDGRRRRGHDREDDTDWRQGSENIEKMDEKKSKTTSLNMHTISSYSKNAFKVHRVPNINTFSSYEMGLVEIKPQFRVLLLFRQCTLCSSRVL
jgi:hypothetical protein